MQSSVFGITKWAYLRGAYLLTSLNVSSGMGLSVGRGGGLSTEFYGIY